jgi:hypothetical protein
MDAKTADIGPVERRLRNLGVEDARHLWRASTIDRAADQVVREATADDRRLGSANSAGASLAEVHRCLVFAWRAIHERGSRNPRPSLDRANHQDDLAAAFTEAGS